MTIMDPAAVADVLAENIVAKMGMEAVPEGVHVLLGRDATGELFPSTLAEAIAMTCDDLGIVWGDVYPVVPDAVSLVMHGDDKPDPFTEAQRTVALHCTGQDALDLMQAMDTLYDANPDDENVASLHDKVQQVGLRLNVL